MRSLSPFFRQVADTERSHLRYLRPVDVALAGVYVVGFAAWGVALARLPSDYDEVYYSHAIWLIAEGDRPYYDFLAVHTPFLWYGLAGLLRWLPDSPRMLLPLRISTGIGLALWLAALIANFRCTRSNLSLRWILAGLGVVLFNAPMLAYAVEFRPDAWAFALFFWALFILRKQGTESVCIRRYACYAFLATGATFACLKVAPFAAMFAFSDSLRLMRRGPNLRAALLGHVFGAGAALAISWLFLRGAQIEVHAVFEFAYRFQLLFENNTGFSHGLLRSLVANPLPLVVACTGLLSWGLYTIRERTAPDPFHASLIAVLAWELLHVHRPYKQYFAPWLLTAAPFVAYTEPFGRLRGGWDSVRLFPVAVVGGVVAIASLAWHRQNEVGPMIQRLQEQIAVRAHEDSAIVAAPPFHPIVRRDVFYAWSRTTDPRGYTTEPAMSELGYGSFVSAERYREELACRDPAVIVLPLPGEDLYEPLQWQIISEFLRRNAERYEIVTEGYIRPFAVKRALADAP